MRSIELFSGAGGLALGLESAGFQSVALVERDRHACATLRLNRPDWNVMEGDVREIDFSGFDDIDLVAGGPPCQPFSMGGLAKGYDDHRDMFPQAVRAVRELQPQAFVFENVRGLLRPCFSNYVEFIRLQLTYPDFPVSLNTDWETNLGRLQKHHTSSGENGLRYKVSIHLADAADYGVPQRRHRVFFVGFRSDVDARWHFPKPQCSEDELLKAQFVNGEYWDEHGISRRNVPDKLKRRVERLASELQFGGVSRWRTVRDAISDLPDPKVATLF